jgi:tetratricopeptide (TPR) repeat protein
MLPRLPAVISAVLLLTLPLACAPADAGDRARLRVCVADFRPEQTAGLNEVELVYCKMLQRAVEDQLVDLAEYYEVEESTRYGTIAKQVANLDSAQAAAVLGEKAGVHEVVTGTVTKAGSIVMVQCHFVSVPRAGASASEASNKIVRNASVECKVAKDEDWIQLARQLQARVKSAVTGTMEPVVQKKVKLKVCKVSEMRPGPNCRATKTITVAEGSEPGECTVCEPPKPTEQQVSVTVCEESGLAAGPNCKRTTTRKFAASAVPGVCNVCKPKAAMDPKEIQLRIAQALKAIDDEKPKDATAALEIVIKEDARNGEAWHLLGVVKFFQNSLKEAEECFKKAIECGYDRASVRDDLANTYFRLASTNRQKASAYYDAALQEAHKSLALAPGNPWAHNTIGCVSYMQSELTRGDKSRMALNLAVDSLKKAAELLTGDPQLLDNAANALLKAERVTEAESYAKEALSAMERTNDCYPPVYSTLSVICKVKGDKECEKRYAGLYKAATKKQSQK